MVDVELADRLGKAATQGPCVAWHGPRTGSLPGIMHLAGFHLVQDDKSVGFLDEDALWLVYARNNWSEIVDEIRRLRDRERFWLGVSTRIVEELRKVDEP